jgi:hypothetical protein
LEEYGNHINASPTSKKSLLEQLTKDPEYTQCVKTVSHRLQLREADINACARVLYHELSKHAHGNTAELVADDTEHARTEVAAIEAVFCTLKKKKCFHIPLRIRAKCVVFPLIIISH